MHMRWVFCTSVVTMAIHDHTQKAVTEELNMEENHIKEKKEYQLNLLQQIFVSTVNVSGK